MRRVLYILGLLKDEDIAWLTGSGSKVKLAVGEVVIQKGEAVENLYILIDGQLGVQLSEKQQEPFKIESGEIIGEISLLDSRPPIATVTALASSLVLQIPKNLLLQKLDRDEGFSGRFYKALGIFLAQRLRSTTVAFGFESGDLEADEVDPDEIDPDLMENLSLAGARFRQIIDQLKGA